MVKKIGTSKNDVFKGTSGNDTYYGLAGNDTFYGHGGTDVIYAGSGDDKIDGGKGYDLMQGSTGNDVYYVDNRQDDVIERLGQGTDKVFSSINYTLEYDVENLQLTGKRSLNGTGNELDNTIIGNAGKNTLRGGVGADTLKGGLGADKLIGGSGADTLSGGGGADRFTYTGAKESGIAEGSSDVILDFRAGVDKIDLSALDANRIVGGNNAFRFIGAAEFTNDVATPPSSFAEVRYNYSADSDETLVLVNIQKAATTIDSNTGNTLSGDTTIDMQIVIRGEITLSAADFIL